MSYNFGFALSYLITPLVIKGVEMPNLLNLNSSFAIIDPIKTQREILKLNIPVAAITILARRLKNRIRYIFDIYQTSLIFIDLKSFSWNIDNSTRCTSKPGGSLRIFSAFEYNRKNMTNFKVPEIYLVSQNYQSKQRLTEFQKI